MGYLWENFPKSTRLLKQESTKISVKDWEKKSNSYVRSEKFPGELPVKIAE